MKQYSALLVLLIPIILAILWLPNSSIDYHFRIVTSIILSLTWLYVFVCEMRQIVETSLSIPVANDDDLISEPSTIDVNYDSSFSLLSNGTCGNSSSCKNEAFFDKFADRQEMENNVLRQMTSKQIAVHQLESILKPDLEFAVWIRRKFLADKIPPNALNGLPFENFDYSLVNNACCENVLGYVPVPVGYAGPLKIDNTNFYIPLATTEGALVASTNRGCRALSMCGGTKTHLIDDFMSRAPVIEFDSLEECVKFKQWLEKPSNFRIVKQMFDGTSRFLSLKMVKTKLVDKLVFLRFCASTGDAMGMNMVSKATETVLNMLCEKYFAHKSMRIVSLSGNYCSDKKAAAVNWICGRGKYVIAEGTVSRDVVSKNLKTTVTSLVHLHLSKNLIGSALAGVAGGYNAHAANIVTAIFLACGQDVAQNVSSSQCLTTLSETKEGDLHISCTMPCLEVGTVGGGTILPAQNACLQMLGCAGGHQERPGANAGRLARTVCAAVVAGELSLLSALSSKDLVRSHLRHNRSSAQLAPTPVVMVPANRLAPSLLEGGDVTKNDANLAKVLDLASSTASLHAETCSKVLT